MWLMPCARKTAPSEMRPIRSAMLMDDALSVPRSRCTGTSWSVRARGHDGVQYRPRPASTRGRKAEVDRAVGRVRPARRHHFWAGVEADAFGAVNGRIAEQRPLPA